MTLIATTLITAAFVALAPAGEQGGGSYAANPSRAEAWQIGPIIRGRNYSVGMPLQPTPARRGWYIDFPYPDRRSGHVHYISFNHGPLTGKRRIIVRYRIDAARGVRFVPQETPEMAATISLVFQRRGDSWSGRGRYEHHRWYSPEQAVAVISPGVHEMVVSLDDGEWTSVHSATAAGNPVAFRDAIEEAERIGIVLGTRAARGHGVYATGPARLTVLSFEVI